MDQSTQRNHKANPFNIARGYVDGKLATANQNPTYDFGSVHLKSSAFHLTVDRVPILRLDARHKRIQISANLYSADGDFMASINRNRWSSPISGVWDIESKFQKLRLRSRRGNINLDIDLSSDMIAVRGQFYYRDQLVHIKDNGIFYSGPFESSIQGMTLDEFDLAVDTQRKVVEMGRSPVDLWLVGP